MVHSCEKFPGIALVEQHLKNQVKQIDRGASEDLVNNDNDDFEIDFKQWMTTYHTELISQELPVDEKINLLSERLDKIKKLDHNDSI